MNLQFNVQAMLDTLPLMLNGMVGGMLVMGALCLVLVLLYAIGGKKKKQDDHTA